jgi:hypothetical protein
MSSSSELSASLSLPPSLQLVVTMTHWGHHFGPHLLPLVLLFAPILAALRDTPQPLLGATLATPWTKTTPTASSLEAYLVAMLSSSFVVFG